MHVSAERLTNRRLRWAPGVISFAWDFPCLPELFGICLLTLLNHLLCLLLTHHPVPPQAATPPPSLSLNLPPPDTTSTCSLSAPLPPVPHSHNPSLKYRAESSRSGDSEHLPLGVGISPINPSLPCSSAPQCQPFGPPPLTAPSNPGRAPHIEQGSLHASESTNFYSPFLQVRLSCITFILPLTRFAHLVTVHSSLPTSSQNTTGSIDPISTYPVPLWLPFIASL